VRAAIGLIAALGGATVATDSPINAQPTPRAFRKHVLAWADVRNGYQHDSISHALATIERLGRESGDYDTFFRTDSQTITKHDVIFPAGTGIARNPTTGTTSEAFQVRTLNYFDAIFFFGVREIDLTAEQRADLLSFIRDDGKGFVAAHSAITSFFSWPEFGEMIGGRFDEHPWGVSNARVVVEDAAFPAMRHLPPSSVFFDEHYQVKDWSRSNVRVLAKIDPDSVDLKAPLVHRTDRDFAVAWTKTYGRGRVFYSTLGHDADTWDDPRVAQMYFQAVRWALRVVD
jgi:type 1 glutamine amidotransferase